MTAPLAGVRVLDLTHFVSGPWCTMLLADLGAEVIKVEPPETGEIGRRMGGVYAEDESAIFLAFNRGKRSVALDLKREEGREAVHRLAEDADVLVHNLRPGTPERLGVGAAELRVLNPTLVYCGISAFGAQGPYASQPGNDPIVQALSGAMLADPDGTGVPIRLGVPVPDFGAGVLAAIAVIAALHRRASTHEGCVVDLNLLDAEMFAQLDRFAHLLIEGTEDGQSVCSGAFRCSDGTFLYLDVGDDRDWARLCEVLERLEWVRRRPDEPRAAVAAALSDHPRVDWLARLRAAKVPAAPVNTLAEAFAGSAGAPLSTTHPTVGELALMRTPIRSEPPWPSRSSPPPLLGEHTEEVLTEAGYDAEAIARLARGGVVGT